MPPERTRSGRDSVDLSDADLRDADLRGADLRDSRLANTDLRDADLRGADLRGTLGLWSSVNLQRARLSGCDLRDVDMSGVDARSAELDRSDLEGSRWDGADLRDCTMRSVRVGWPSVWLARLATGSGARSTASFAEADLGGADLTGSRLPGSVFRRSNLERVRASGAVLTSAVLAGTNLSGADLHDVDLCGADLRDAVLVGACLRGAALVGAQLSGARLDGADLLGARFGGTSARGAEGEAASGNVVGPQTCLLLAQPDSAVANRVHTWLASRRSDVHRCAPDELASPAGPVPVAFEYEAHPMTVVVRADGEHEPVWLRVLRRSAADRPAWLPRPLVEIVESGRDDVRVVAHGSVPNALARLVSELVEAFGPEVPASAEEEHA